MIGTDYKKEGVSDEKNRSDHLFDDYFGVGGVFKRSKSRNHL